MSAYFLRRILAAIPVMGVVAVFVFLLLRLTPGDPAAIIAGDMATAEQLAKIRAALGLDQPLLTQFFSWIGRLLQGDFGVSLISQTPVTTLIAQRLEPTLSLAVLTAILAVLIAVPIGVLAAWKHQSWIDNVVMSMSVLGFSIPVFVIGYILVQIFAIELKWLPVQGYRSWSNGIWPFLQRAILPALTLSSIYIALIARMTRASLLNVLGALGTAAAPPPTLLGSSIQRSFPLTLPPIVPPGPSDLSERGPSRQSYRSPPPAG